MYAIFHGNILCGLSVAREQTDRTHIHVTPTVYQKLVSSSAIRRRTRLQYNSSGVATIVVVNLDNTTSPIDDTLPIETSITHQIDFVQYVDAVRIANNSRAAFLLDIRFSVIPVLLSPARSSINLDRVAGDKVLQLLNRGYGVWVLEDGSMCRPVINITKSLTTSYARAPQIVYATIDENHEVKFDNFVGGVLFDSEFPLVVSQLVDAHSKTQYSTIRKLLSSKSAVVDYNDWDIKQVQVTPSATQTTSQLVIYTSPTNTDDLAYRVDDTEAVVSKYFVVDAAFPLVVHETGDRFPTATKQLSDGTHLLITDEFAHVPVVTHKDDKGAMLFVNTDGSTCFTPPKIPHVKLCADFPLIPLDVDDKAFGERLYSRQGILSSLACKTLHVHLSFNDSYYVEFPPHVKQVEQIVNQSNIKTIADLRMVLPNLLPGIDVSNIVCAHKEFPLIVHGTLKNAHPFQKLEEVMFV